tara:strand:- start:88 stop:393 length:306 start_codon:yes stop_codon:yes gene_type:complete
MTTWTTFETLDEIVKDRENSDSEYERNIDSTFWVDRLGNLQYHENQFDRQSRFEVTRTPKPDGSLVWSVIDLIGEEDRPQFTTGSMETIVGFIAGRVLYGA